MGSRLIYGAEGLKTHNSIYWLTCNKLNNKGGIRLRKINLQTDGGNSGDYFSKFQFIQNGRFSSSVKANHKNSHLFFAKQALEQACKYIPHGDKAVKDGDKNKNKLGKYPKVIQNRVQMENRAMTVGCAQVDTVRLSRGARTNEENHQSGSSTHVCLG